jgi:hypothetical protein
MIFLLLRSDKPGKGWQIHAVRCWRSRKFNPNNVQTIEATSAKALIEAELNRNNGELRNAGWSAKSFHVMPCVGLRRLIELLKERAWRRARSTGAPLMDQKEFGLACDVKVQLIHAWSRSAETFSESVRALSASKMPSAEYAALKSKAEQARAASEGARLALQAHREKHGC